MMEKSNGVLGNSEPCGDTWRHPVKSTQDRDYHISRVIYFMDHTEEIKGIEVDNPCVDDEIFPRCIIVNGWHRMAAAIILHTESGKMWIDYGGRSDVQD